MWYNLHCNLSLIQSQSSSLFYIASLFTSAVSGRVRLGVRGYLQSEAEAPFLLVCEVCYVVILVPTLHIYLSKKWGIRGYTLHNPFVRKVKLGSLRPRAKIPVQNPWHGDQNIISSTQGFLFYLPT